MASAQYTRDDYIALYGDDKTRSPEDLITINSLWAATVQVPGRTDPEVRILILNENVGEKPLCYDGIPCTLLEDLATTHKIVLTDPNATCTGNDVFQSGLTITTAKSIEDVLKVGLPDDAKVPLSRITEPRNGFATQLEYHYRRDQHLPLPDKYVFTEDDHRGFQQLPIGEVAKKDFSAKPNNPKAL